MRTLGGSLFFYNPEKYDYCWREAIRCLQEFCDEISIVDAGSDDGTQEQLKEFENQKTKIICLNEWSLHSGKEKLSYFSNIAHAILGTDYIINLQADEIIHEDSYEYIRKAIETGKDGFLCTRYNLWRDNNSYLIVPQERQPCSKQVIRLAKIGTKSFDDAENMLVQASDEFVNDIKFFHYGFTRKKEVMIDKIKHMQENIFGMSADEKLKNMEVLQSEKWFTDEDLAPLPYPHPKIMQEWISTRP